MKTTSQRFGFLHSSLCGWARCSAALAWCCKKRYEILTPQKLFLDGIKFPSGILIPHLFWVAALVSLLSLPQKLAFGSKFFAPCSLSIVFFAASRVGLGHVATKGLSLNESFSALKAHLIAILMFLWGRIRVQLRFLRLFEDPLGFQWDLTSMNLRFLMSTY